MSEPARPAALRAAADEYASTVVAPAQIALGAVSGVLVAIILVALNSALWPAAALALLLAVGVGIYLGVVTVTVGAGRVELGQGRGEHEPRLVYASEVRSAQAQDLSWLQCFGIRMPPARRSTRLSVRPGQTLVLVTNDDELIAVSTPDAERALELFTRGRPSAAPADPAPVPRVAIAAPPGPAVGPPARPAPGRLRPAPPRPNTPPNPPIAAPRPRPRG